MEHNLWYLNKYSLCQNKVVKYYLNASGIVAENSTSINIY